MNVASRTEDAVLPLALARDIEAAYQRFASAWRLGQPPLIEGHLAGLPGPARTVLLPELLELELSCRRRAGETVCPEEYRQRFPQHAALIASIVREDGWVPSSRWWFGAVFSPPTEFTRTYFFHFHFDRKRQETAETQDRLN